MGFIFGTSFKKTSQDNRTYAKTEKGGFNIMRYGAGPSGPMRTLGQYMLGSGVTFGYVSYDSYTWRLVAHIYLCSG